MKSGLFFHLSLFYLVTSLTLAGCNYNHVKKESPVAGAQVNAMLAASLDYPSLQMNVLGPQCLRCHSSAGGNQGGLSLESYQQVRSNMNRIYYRSIEKRDMPPNSLSNAQFDLLKGWLEAGAPEKNTGRRAGTIKGPINWTVIKNQVLRTSCLDCHSGKNPDAGLDFESLEVVKNNISNIFKSAIVNQTMPLEPYSALSETEKQALLKWISQGMPE